MSKGRTADLRSTAAWAFKVIGVTVGTFATVYFWPLIQKIGEDEGWFGEKAARFGPLLRSIFGLIGDPVFSSIATATVAVIAGGFYGRWLVGTIREDGPTHRFRVTSPDDLTAALELPILGYTLKAQSLLDEARDFRSTYTENIHQLAAMTKRWRRSLKGGVLAVTSDRPAAGKTSTALNLARSFARSGLKVLVIDCDLRNPSLHRQAGVDNYRGLTLFLSGQGDAASCIQRRDDIWVMPAGPLPPEPPTLVAGLFENLIGELRSTFDYIFVDTPPFAFAEVLTITDAADGYIFLVQHGSNLLAARAILDRIRGMSETPGALFMTRIPVRRAASSWTGWSYSYDYNYGAAPIAGPKEGGANSPVSGAGVAPSGGTSG